MTEDSLPKSRATLTAAWDFGKFELTARSRFYGEWSDFTDTFPANAAPGATYPTYAPQVFKAMAFLDLVASYEVTDKIKVMVGAENVLDQYPDKSRWQTFRGLDYSRNSPYSTDGGYYYGRVDFRF
jgi:iron complex outermembrane receptor protein